MGENAEHPGHVIHGRILLILVVKIERQISYPFNLPPDVDG